MDLKRSLNKLCANYVLRASDNRRISPTVHVSRMKPYVDPASRPILCPPKDIDESFLLERELPTDSFAPDQSTTATTEALPNTADSQAKTTIT